MRVLLIFFPATRTVSVEKQNVMWRFGNFLYMKHVLKAKMSPHVEKFQISSHDRCINCLQHSVFLLPTMSTNEDHDAAMINMQRGSRCNDDQDATRIKMQRGSTCNVDQDGTFSSSKHCNFSRMIFIIFTNYRYHS